MYDEVSASHHTLQRNLAVVRRQAAMMLFPPLFPNLHGIVPIRRLNFATVLHHFPSSMAHNVLNSTFLADQACKRFRPALPRIKSPRVRIQTLIHDAFAVFLSFYFPKSSFRVVWIWA